MTSHLTDHGNSFLYIIAGVLMFDMFAGMSRTSLDARQYQNSNNTELKQTSDQSGVNRRLNKHISHRNSFVHADIGESDYDGHINDASSAPTFNKLWFSVGNGFSPRKR